MTALFQFALAPYFVEVYCLFIFLVFAVTLGWWLRSSYVLRKELSESLPPQGNHSEFAKRFEKYGAQVAKRFPQLWPQYRAALIPKPDEITSLVSASQYINDATVIASKLPVHVYSAVPNILTGLGILGTFLGLAGGIYQATAGITSTDTGAIRDSLSALLDGAALAFVTSIVGVAFSILFLVPMRRGLRAISGLAGDWASRLDELVQLRTPAYIAVKQLEEAKETTKSLKDFATDLAVAIAKETEPHVKGLREELQGLRSDRATDSGKIIKDALEEFAQVLSRQAGNQFDTLANTVGDLNSSLATSVRLFEESQESVNQTFRSLVAKMETSMNKNTNTMSREIERSFAEATDAVGEVSKDFTSRLTLTTSKVLAEMDSKLNTVTAALAQAGTTAAGNISESSEGLKDAVNTLARSTTQSEHVLGRMTRVAGDFDRLHATIEKTGEQVGRIIAPLQRATTSIQESVDRTAVVLEDTGTLVERIESSTQRLETHNESLTQIWKDYQGRFKDVDQSLAQVFEKISESLASYSHQVTEFAKVLDTTAGEAIEKLAAATGELSGTVEELIEALPNE